MAQAIRDELIEELLGEEGVFKELKKRLLERALGAELSEHLGYEKGDRPAAAAATAATGIRVRP